MIYLLKVLKFLKRKFLKKISPGFWSNSKILINDKTKFIIDLSNPKISHFGDNLFFISAFKDKEISNFKFLVSKKYFFLWEKFGFDNMATKIDEDLEEYIYVSTLETNFSASPALLLSYSNWILFPVIWFAALITSKTE